MLPDRANQLQAGVSRAQQHSLYTYFLLKTVTERSMTATTNSPQVKSKLTSTQTCPIWHGA